MASEINTFSSLIDTCMARANRFDRLNDIISYARLTVREIQALGQFQQDVIEDQISGVTVDPYVWVTPAPFRAMLSVQYAGISDEQGNPIYAKYRELGKGQLREEYFYYRSGDSHVFVGHGGRAGGSIAINIAYLEYSRSFKYFAVASDRPAVYDDVTESWTYEASYDLNDTTRETARRLVSNWVLFNWFDVLVEGTLAKVYKLVDDSRAGASFSFFERQKKVIQSGETTAYTGFNR